MDHVFSSNWTEPLDKTMRVTETDLITIFAENEKSIHDVLTAEAIIQRLVHDFVILDIQFLLFSFGLLLWGLLLCLVSSCESVKDASRDVCTVATNLFGCVACECDSRVFTYFLDDRREFDQTTTSESGP